MSWSQLWAKYTFFSFKNYKSDAVLATFFIAKFKKLAFAHLMNTEQGTKSFIE